jgi:hypothetical protein
MDAIVARGTSGYIYSLIALYLEAKLCNTIENMVHSKVRTSIPRCCFAQAGLELRTTVPVDRAAFMDTVTMFRRLVGIYALIAMHV